MQSIQSEVNSNGELLTVHVYKDRFFSDKCQVHIILFNNYCVK
jgi:hypothetical protein